MTPYEIFRIHRALVLHFTTDYDCLKYNFKINISYESYKKRRDCVFYNRLYKKDVIIRDCLNFILANVIEDAEKFAWVGNLLTPEAEQNYVNFIKRKEALTYTFKDELDQLQESVIDLIKVDAENSNFYPKLFVKYLQGEVSIHFITLINKITQYIPYWDKNINDTIIWPEYKRKIEKYTQLVHIKDIQKLKTILSEHEQNIQEYTEI